MSNFRFETLCLHAGQSPDPTHLSVGVPIHRTTAYQFKSTEHAANLFGLKELGNIYSRLMNPTQGMLEERITALEGGAASLALASGTAGIHYTVINLCRQGDEIVSAKDLYGGTYTMFDAIHPEFGIKTNFVQPTAAAIAAAITPKTRLIFIETCGNPGLNVPDFAAIADVARAHNLPLAVDNTFATPALLRPIEHGANIVCESLTKWIGGHGTGLGGSVTDAGNFNWKDEKFALYNNPDPNYHGLRWAHDLPPSLAPVAFILRMRTVPLRNLGACISADNSWLFMQGMETLPLRMERHCSNAMAVAKHLESHKLVDWVIYPGLASHPGHAVAKKYLKNGFGGMVSFGIKGGAEKGPKFIEALKMFRHLANVGDAKSLAIHPWTTTHSQLNDAQKEGAGITPGMVRLSVGIEHINDIVEDIEQALTAAQ